MAIARQESAWNPKVKSPVGASGLMQIMPGTATHTVKMFSIPGYSSPSQLLDPDTNINIGTSYLQYVYQQFGNNRILRQQPITPVRDAFAPGLAIALAALMPSRLSRAFHSQRRVVM